MSDSSSIIIFEAIPKNCQRAVFAAGCFWCLEATLQALEGVRGAINGYAGGQPQAPSYRDVCQQKTDHREAVLVYYEADKISYEQLLEAFWGSIDPFDVGGQFFDRGFSYSTAIFYLNEAQKNLAEKSKSQLQKEFDRPIVTEILAFSTFFEAEEYHQDFYRKYPQRYQNYAQASNREEYKQLVWQAILKQKKS